jgi:multidrug transporter EmrE-like cation transporter
MNRAWIFVALCLVGTVSGQMVLKYAMGRHGRVPGEPLAAVGFVARALADPLVLLSLALAFGASLAWIAAISRLSLGTAYPFMSLAFVATAVLSALLLNESISTVRWVGIATVVAGLVLVARG